MSRTIRLSEQDIATLSQSRPGASVAPRREADPRLVQPFVFGNGETAGLAEYHGLRMVNERFSRLARTAFSPLLRFQPRITAHPPQLGTFDSYRTTHDNFAALTISQIAELRGTQMVVVPASFVSLLTNAYYGGDVASAQVARGEFTATEQRVVETVTERLHAALQVSWRDLTRFTIVVTAREENMQLSSFAEAEEKIVTCGFTVQLPNAEDQRFDVIYPFQMLKPIASLLRSRMHSDQLGEDRSWRERLEHAVMSIPVGVSVRLCEPVVPLHRLLSLAPGDVLPVSLPGTADILVAGRLLFCGQPGEQGGHAAVSILRQSPE
jgi:flagellar motor switch protein FliM